MTEELVIDVRCTKKVAGDEEVQQFRTCSALNRITVWMPKPVEWWQGQEEKGLQ